MSKTISKLFIGSVMGAIVVLVGSLISGTGTAQAATDAATATCPSTVAIATVAPGTTVIIQITLSGAGDEDGEGEYFRLSDGSDYTDYSYDAGGTIVETFTATDSALDITGCTTPGIYGDGYDYDESAIVDSVSATPDTLDACKKGGWTSLVDSEGNSFKNQGDCVSFVATQGKNLGSIAP